MKYFEHSILYNANGISIIYKNGDTILVRFVKDTWFMVIAEYERDIMIIEGNANPFNQ